MQWDINLEINVNLYMKKGICFIEEILFLTQEEGITQIDKHPSIMKDRL